MVGSFLPHGRLTCGTKHRKHSRSLLTSPTHWGISGWRMLWLSDLIPPHVSHLVEPSIDRKHWNQCVRYLKWGGKEKIDISSLILLYDNTLIWNPNASINTTNPQISKIPTIYGSNREGQPWIFLLVDLLTMQREINHENKYMIDWLINQPTNLKNTIRI